MKVIISNMAWIEKSSFKLESDVPLLRNQCTIIPTVTYSGSDKVVRPIKMYRETENYFGVPRHFYRKHNNRANDSDITYDVSDGIPLTPNSNKIELREYDQEPVAQDMFNTLTAGEWGCGLMEAYTGFGKCSRRGTEIIMYSGDVKKVEDIEVGDLLMGPDSNPREVQNLVRGHGKMFKVTPTKGDPWFCNEDHILSLKVTQAAASAQDWLAKLSGQIVNMTVKEYLTLPGWAKHRLKQWRTGIDFEKKKVDTDPYFMGLWLQDGTRIPDCYKLTDRESRLEFLAGLLDANGHLVEETVFEISTKFDELKEDILFLARSLGFAAYAIRKSSIEDDYWHAYWCITISGNTDDIPCKIKKPKKRDQIKNHLVTGFKIEQIDDDDYYGFNLDKDHLYLMKDFTVTHNSVLTIELICRLGGNAIILVHSEALKDQWINNVKKFYPNARIGEVQADVCNYRNKDIVIGMIQSIMQDDNDKYPKEFYRYFRTMVVDECLDVSTLIAVRSGHKRLSDIQIGDEVRTPNGFAHVKDKWITKKEAYKYIFDSGRSLIASDCHLVSEIKCSSARYRVKNSYREINKIGEINYIEPFNGKSFSNSYNSRQVSPMKYLIGWFIADGTNDRGAIKFKFKKEEKASILKNLLDKLALSYSFKKTNRDSYLFRLSRKERNIFERFGYSPGFKSNTISIPKTFFDQCDLSVLKGIYDGDGTFTTDRVELSTASIELRDQVSDMLSSLGIIHSKKTYLRDKKHSPRHKVIIFGDQLFLFNEIIGFRILSKFKKLSAYLAKVKTVPKFRERKVETIPVGVRTLIDIELDNDEKLFIANGFVVHNCHRMGSECFGKAAPKFNPKYAFGMSGTMRRKDGCMNVFKWTLGDVVVTADETMRIKPKVYLRETGCDFPRKEWQVLDKKTNKIITRVYDADDTNRALLLNYIAKEEIRNKKIAADIIRALRKGRNPLVMSERKIILEKVAKYVEAFAKVDPILNGKSISHGFYVGGKSKSSRKEELAAAARCDVVYATIQLAKEGIDIPRLETLFMATPLSDVEQLIGRVCRPTIKWEEGRPVVVPKEHEAMVLDYVDGDSSFCRALSYKRQAQYQRLGWQIIGSNY